MHRALGSHSCFRLAKPGGLNYPAFEAPKPIPSFGHLSEMCYNEFILRDIRFRGEL